MPAVFKDVDYVKWKGKIGLSPVEFLACFLKKKVALPIVPLHQK